MLSRRDTGGTRNSRRNCQEHLEKVKLMLVRDIPLPFQEPSLVRFGAKESVLTARRSRSQFPLKLLKTLRMELILRASRSLRLLKKKLRPRKKKPKRKERRKLQSQEKKKNHQRSQPSQSSQTQR